MAGLSDEFRLMSEGGNPLHSYHAFTVIGAINDGSQTMIYGEVDGGENAPADMGFKAVDTELLNGYSAPNMVLLSSMNPSGVENIQRQAVLAAASMIPNLEGALPPMDAVDAIRIINGNFDAETASELLADGGILEAASEHRMALHNSDVGADVDVTDPEHIATIVGTEKLYAQISVATSIGGYVHGLQSALDDAKLEELGVSERDVNNARDSFANTGLENSVLEPLAGTGQQL